ncbi:B-box type zinc finger family protein [Euphorbia peplus]|nr:B-box type zinc finger family protein [Euphorbia peplus]
MCRGIEEKRRMFCKKPEEDCCNWANSEMVRCELCDSRAYVYCQADDAFLCQKCDQWVHEANFLALRHIRCFLCHTCHNLTSKYLVGTSVHNLLPPVLTLAVEQPTTSPMIDDDDDDDKQSCASLKMPFLFL